MPYIKDYRRELLRKDLDALVEKLAAMDAVSGDMNYIFTKLALWYAGIKPNYQSYQDVIGALECAKLELYRRHIAPYEDKKITENGDV